MINKTLGSIKHRMVLRNWYELQNYYKFYQIGMKNSFFISKYNNKYYHYWENLNSLSPVLIDSIANYCLFNYKVNHYPYYDMNLVNFFIDINQSVNLCKQLLRFYEKNLPANLYEKISIYLVPMYEDTSNRFNKNFVLPEKISLIENPVYNFDFEKNQFNLSHSLKLQNDPLYIILFNDILKYLSHDLVLYDKNDKIWKQCYIDTTLQEQSFSKNIDDSCYDAIQTFFQDQDPSDQLMYHIPTRLMQFLKFINTNLPDNKLFLIDSIKNHDPQNKFQVFFNKLYHKRTIGDSIHINSDSTVTYSNDFETVQNLYFEINDSLKTLKYDSMSQFIDQWSLTQPVDRDLARLIENSSLAILHS